MNTFLRYLVYWFIVLYIIGWIRIALLRMLEYILGSQRTHEGVVVHRRSHRYVQPLTVIYLQGQGICEWAVYKNPWMLNYVPDHFKIREMCDDAVMENPLLLRYVPDWSVTQQLTELWNDCCNDDEIIEWFEGYKKRKAQKAKMKEELLPIAWHPSCVMEWCMSEDEKRRRN